ncbi:MAG TPA: ferredoxin [Streptosporangiaceae bacterium]|nr:ferredoxin [Streptosporangiaceae bacterium]
MRVIVDRDKCCGYGECVAIAPDLFRIGDDNRAHLIPQSELSVRDAELVREASYSCPVEAIEISE